MKNIVIIGAGGLGATTAALLSRMDLDIHITLVDANPYIYGGAIEDANVNHRTGFEYLKPNHNQTGVDCIHGGIAKDLICGDIFGTSIPNRFWVSDATNQSYGNGWELFEQNAKFMRDTIYQPLYDHITNQRGKENLPLAAPERFGFLLPDETKAGLSGITDGYGSTGGTVVMAYDYALKMAAIREAEKAEKLTLMLGKEVTSIAEQNGKYRVGGVDVEADMVLVTAAHQIPKLAQNLNGAKPAEGTYHLNGILYVKLPATPNDQLREQVSRINFVVQGAQGCMFAPVLAPTATEDGLAAIYYPAEKGSQVERHVHRRDSRIVPDEWNSYIREGLPTDIKTGEVPQTRNERIEGIMQQAYQFNPFLQGYIEPQELRVRTVFNPITLDNADGLDRRVRQIIRPAHLSEDGMVMAMTSPKWTTLELAALDLIQEALVKIGVDKKLPTHETHGLGQNKLDIGQISRDLNLLDIALSRQDALDFATRNGQPQRIVDTNAALFMHENISPAGNASELGDAFKNMRKR